MSTCPETCVFTEKVLKSHKCMGNKLADILIINSIQALIDYAVSTLEKEGYRVHTASSMRDALSIVVLKPIGLILCGLELEDISGEHFLSYLKRDPLRESIPFIFFLPLESRMKLSPRQALQIGAEGVIFCPLETSIFISRIKKILRPPKGPGSDAPAKIDLAAKSPSVNSKLNPTTSEQKSKPERKSEKRKQPKTQVAVEISYNGKSWTPGLILNHGKSGAMIETTLDRAYGTTVHIREPKDAGHVISGSVAHMLLGDENEQIGFGVIFHREAKWPGFSERLMNKNRKQFIRSINPDFFPIAVEVSRDGFFWVNAQISGCNTMGAHLQTTILGKPKEKMKVKFEQHGLENIIIGKIKQVELVDKELLAIIKLDFEEDDGWFQVYDHFVALAGSGPIDKKNIKTVAKTSKTKTIKSGSAESQKNEKWAETVLIQKGVQRKSAPQNQRFYQSLIGRKMDNYEVVSFISSGGMGGVFKGWDVALERDVALKVISWELSSQEEFVKMFFKEARFISKLNHPNISQIYYIGKANNIIYYAMEFVHGQTLADLIKKNVRCQIPQVVNYLKVACNALDFVWKNKIIHRDIKPANIMVTSAGVIKIVDFGVAKFDTKGGDIQSGNKLVGSPLYLSPENIRNQKIDHRSDIYSLGATFYHLLVGSPPFYADSFRNILQKQLNEPVPSLRLKAPDIPDFLCEIIEKMLAKKLDDRFQNYQQIIESLSSVVTEKKYSINRLKKSIVFKRK